MPEFTDEAFTVPRATATAPLDPEARRLAERFLGAWNSQEVDRVVGVYTPDVAYRDPNTRGEVRGAEAMRRYLTKLFAAWKMEWSLREAYPLTGGGGYAVLWRATLQRAAGGPKAGVEGMDLVVMRGDLIARNEVYFDRAALMAVAG